jgi:hypothetical protein
MLSLLLLTLLKNDRYKQYEPFVILIWLFNYLLSDNNTVKRLIWPLNWENKKGQDSIFVFRECRN